MRNKYGILLPIEIILDENFVSGNSILDYISEETKNYLFELAEKIKESRSNGCGINIFSKLPFIHFYNPNTPVDLLTFGTIFCVDDGVKVLHIGISNENYFYDIYVNGNNKSITMNYTNW